MNSTADQLGFDTLKHQTSDFNVAAQTSASLLYKDRNIHIRDIQLTEDGQLTGVVSGIENVCAVQYEGLRIGQTITFRPQHIHQLI